MTSLACGEGRSRLVNKDEVGVPEMVSQKYLAVLDENCETVHVPLRLDPSQ